MPIVEVPSIGDVHFPDDMDKPSMEGAIKKLLLERASGRLDPSKSSAGTLGKAEAFSQKAATDLSKAQANPEGSLLSSPSALDANKQGIADQARKIRPLPLPKTTPGQVLAEENRPQNKAFETLINEGSAGLGGVASLDPLETLKGAAQALNAPAAAAGEAVGTTTHNILSNIPGLGGPAGVIPAGGAALANAVAQVGAGTGIMKGVVSGAKSAYKGAAELLNPGAVRKAGVEAVASRAGRQPSVIERAFESPPSKAAYAEAEKIGAVKTNDFADITEEAFLKHSDISNPNRPALTYLSNLEKKFRDSGHMSYGQVMEEIQQLKSKADSAFSGARPNNVLGKTLMTAREALIDQMDKISPAYRNANALYRHESATTDIINAVRSGTPGAALDKLIENEPKLAQTLGKGATEDISAIADRLNDVASSTPAGGFRQMLSAITEPLGQMIGSVTGRKLLRKTLEATKKTTPQSLNAAIQLWQGYKASGGQE